MNIKAQAAKNVSATWLNLLVHAVVGFFLSPFILHRLGDELFNLWVLIFALSGYYGLLDLGIRSSIVRHVAKFSATGEKDDLARFLSTSLIFYAVAALVVLLLTGVGSFYLQHWFRIPPSHLPAARMLFLLAGAGVALSFPLSAFAGILEGLQKFSWVQLSQLGITLLRGVLIVLALNYGGRLLAIGAITVAMNVLGYLIFLFMSLRKFPIHVSIRQADRNSLKTMLAYGSFAFIILLAEKLRFHSDAILIGAFFPATAITSFSIGARLVEYATYAVRSLAQIFTPMSSQFHATGDFARLRRTLVVGNQACALVIFPLCVTLIVFGKSIIEAWVGARYVSSYPVLVWLIVPKTLYLAQSTSTRVLLGIDKHRTLAFVLLLEGVANLLLSACLSRYFGVLGVALGTAIPLACTSLVFLPRHVCCHLDMPLGRFLTRAYSLPLTLCVPLATVLWLVKNKFPVHGYSRLMLHVTCGVVAYGFGLALVTCRGRPVNLRSWKFLVQSMEPKL